jgi:hypothetical protein
MTLATKQAHCRTRSLCSRKVAYLSSDGNLSCNYIKETGFVIGNSFHQLSLCIIKHCDLITTTRASRGKNPDCAARSTTP